MQRGEKNTKTMKIIIIDIYTGWQEQFEEEKTKQNFFLLVPSAVHCLIQPVISPKELVSTAVDKMASSCSSWKTKFNEQI